MQIPTMYNIADIKDIENEVLAILPPVSSNSNHHYLEPVGYYLWMEWNRTKSDSDKDRFILYMMPLIYNLILPHIRFLNNNLEYGDLFQLCVIRLIEHMPKYNPTRLNKLGETSKVFTYFTLIIQYYIKYITAKNWHQSNKNSNYDAYEIGTGTDAYTVYTDFIDFLGVLKEKKNLRESHKAIYNALYEMLINEDELHKLSNNLLSTIANKAGIKRDSENILSAFRLLRKAYGKLKIQNISFILPLLDEEL